METLKMIGLILVVVVLFALFWIFSKKENLRRPLPNNQLYKTEGFTNIDASFSLPSRMSGLKSGKEYLDEVSDATFGDTAQTQHMNYVQKRKNAGDHTLQLWGVDSSRRGYSSNFVGPRPPRQFNVDPLSPLQQDTMDLKDYAAPQAIRFI